VNAALLKTAQVAVNEVLGIKEGERVLIITNPRENVYRISQSLYLASHIAQASVTLMVQPEKTTLDFIEPAVINAIKTEPNVIISVSADRLGKDKEGLADPYNGLDGKKYTHVFNYLLWGVKKIRAFWSPRITIDMFTRTVPIDYSSLRRTAAGIVERMKNAAEIRVVTELGTNIAFGVRGREIIAEDGNFKTPGKGGNLPCGEVSVSPTLETSEGTVVFDGSITLDRSIIIREPIKISVKKGFVTEINGRRESKELEAYIRKAENKPFEMSRNCVLAKEKAEQYARNARNLGEFGIGLNPKAKIVGKVLEDEKVLGTVHFAIGSNYDQDALALIHIDGIVNAPTVTVDGKPLIRKGKLLT
jgi:leucyl aminopeptidase (aminopeptidase T)